MNRYLSCLVLLLAAVICGPLQAQDGGTLKKIADKRSISLGYRLDAAPFSFLGSDALPAGYSVDLCKRVVASIEQQLNVGRLTLAVGAGNLRAAHQQGGQRRDRS
jgi:glutamate/aspartate transport system substrate-binding protein